jgi:hypothetical protein
MTGRALSQAAKARQHNKTTEKWMERAVNLYRDENGDSTGKKLGLKKFVVSLQSNVGQKITSEFIWIKRPYDGEWLVSRLKPNLTVSEPQRRQRRQRDD